MANDRYHSTPAIDGEAGLFEVRPSRLWVTCSDSPPGLFDLTRDRSALLHTNPGNLAMPSDMSFLASLKMAVDIYDVGEIVVCGHYGCGAIAAAASGTRRRIVGDWLFPLKALAGKRSGSVAGASGEGPTANTLAEMNVMQQMLNVSRTSVLREAWAAGRRITVSGIIFDPAAGTFSSVGEPISSAILR